MEQRIANAWHLSINEKKFIESALLNDIRIDGRQPFDYRQITIKFGKEDGSSEVQLGDTHVIGYVSGQLVQPYRDRPNEGTLSIFVEFSPMADPAFEPGRPGEFAVELGRLIDRGLRESRAVDMESLCVAAGKSVWAIRVDLHILDNGGNLIDAANIAALTALLSYRRPECTLGGENGQDVFIHDIEVRDPLPLIVHHVPVAVTFAFLNEGDLMVIDPTYKEEAIMGGRMTATLNSNGDICAVQKSGGAGVSSNMIMQCLRLAALKAVDITSKIKNAVDAHDAERALRKVKRRTSWTAPEINVSNIMVKDDHSDQFAKHPAQNINDQAGRTFDATTVHKKHSNFIKKEAHAFIGASSNWDPYTQGISTNLAKNAQFFPDESQETDIIQMQIESRAEETTKANVAPHSSSSSGASGVSRPRKPPKSLEDSVKSKRSNKNRDVS